MHENKQLIAQLKRHEGTKRDSAGLHVAYLCTAGALTIGYGHNLDANPVPGLHKGSRLTEDQAERLLVADIKKFCMDLDKYLPWWRKLDEARRGVLVNMVFNMGIGFPPEKDAAGRVTKKGRGLRSFVNTLELVQQGKYANAADNMLSPGGWAAQVGRRATELAEQMRNGRWS